MDFVFWISKWWAVVVVLTMVVKRSVQDERYRCPSTVNKQSPYVKTYGNHCFEFSTTTKTWNSARSYCHEKQGYLAEVKSKGLQDFLASSANSLGYDDVGFFIGLHHASTWIWINSNTNLGWSNWGSGEPSWLLPLVDCVAMIQHHGFKWYDKLCHNTHYYHWICQFDMSDPTTTTTTTTTTPTTTTTTPETTTPSAPPTKSTEVMSSSEVAVVTSAITTQKTTLPIPVDPSFKENTQKLTSADNGGDSDILLPVILSIVLIIIVVLCLIFYLFFVKRYKCISKNKLAEVRLGGFDNVVYTPNREPEQQQRVNVTDIQNNLNQLRQENIYSLGASPYLQPVPQPSVASSTSPKDNNLQLAKKNSGSLKNPDKLFVNLEGDNYDNIKEAACGGCYDTIDSANSDTLQKDVNLYSEIYQKANGKDIEKTLYDDLSFDSYDKSKLDESDENSDDNESIVDNEALNDNDVSSLSKDGGGLAFENNCYQEKQ